MCVLISSTTFVWNISHSKNWARYDQKKYIYFFLRKGPGYSCQILMNLEFSWHIFKIHQVYNCVKILTLRAELFHVDGRTDRHDEDNGWSLFSVFQTRLKILQSAHTLFKCAVFISEQTATFALHNINGLVFMTETKSVYCAVRNRSYLNSLRFVFKGLICHVWKYKRKVKWYIYVKPVMMLKSALLKVPLQT